MVFEAAMENPQEVVGVLSFSPGEYDDKKPKMVEEWAARVTQPVFVACGVEEEDLSKPIFEALPGAEKVFYRAGRGRHGSSMLLDDASNWKAVLEFLGRDWTKQARK